MSKNTVDVVIKATDQYSTTMEKFKSSIDGVSEKSKVGAESVASFLSAFGGGQFAGPIGQLAQMTQRVKELNIQFGNTAKGALAIKGAIAGIAGFGLFTIGQAIYENRGAFTNQSFYDNQKRMLEELEKFQGDFIQLQKRNLDKFNRMVENSTKDLNKQIEDAIKERDELFSSNEEGFKQFALAGAFKGDPTRASEFAEKYATSGQIEKYVKLEQNLQALLDYDYTVPGRNIAEARDSYLRNEDIMDVLSGQFILDRMVEDLGGANPMIDFDWVGQQAVWDLIDQGRLSSDLFKEFTTIIETEQANLERRLKAGLGPANQIQKQLMMQDEGFENWWSQTGFRREFILQAIEKVNKKRRDLEQEALDLETEIATKRQKVFEMQQAQLKAQLAQLDKQVSLYSEGSPLGAAIPAIGGLIGALSNLNPDAIKKYEEFTERMQKHQTQLYKSQFSQSLTAMGARAALPGVRNRIQDIIELIRDLEDEKEVGAVGPIGAIAADRYLQSGTSLMESPAMKTADNTKRIAELQEELNKLEKKQEGYLKNIWQWFQSQGNIIPIVGV